MNKNFTRMLLLAFFCLTFCSISVTIGQDSSKKILKVNGAGMASNQVDKWAKQFMTKTPDVSVTVVGSSAGKGFQSFLEGNTDIAMMSREIRSDERRKANDKGIQLAEKPIGYAAIALITNQRNPVNELSLDQLRRLYTGEYDNWKMVGGPDEPVKCLSRRIPESGGAVFFWEKVLGGEPFGNKTVMTETWETISKVCSSSQELSLGIVPSTRENTGVKLLKIRRDDGSPAVFPTEENIKNQSYPIILPFSFVWNAQSKEVSAQKFVEFCQMLGGANN